MTSDWELIRKAKNGDKNSWDDLFLKYYDHLIRVAALILGSVDGAKDIVQETFLRLIRSRIKHYKGNFKSYVTLVAFRLALKEKKRITRSKNIDELNFIDNSLQSTNEIINSEHRRLILNAITSLPEEQKKILVLRFYGEYSYEEIAQIISIPLGTVKSRVFYAVKACRDKLREKGVLE
jgi:RNA polymerase sigma-70 factor (ECF subfamily)